MSILTAALGTVLSFLTQEFHPSASVLVHVANDAWSGLRSAAVNDASEMGQQVLSILGNVVQETVSTVGIHKDNSATQVQFAAGDWQSLKQIHAAATGAPHPVGAITPTETPQVAPEDAPAQPVATSDLQASAPQLEVAGDTRLTGGTVDIVKPTVSTSAPTFGLSQGAPALTPLKPLPQA